MKEIRDKTHLIALMIQWGAVVAALTIALYLKAKTVQHERVFQTETVWAQAEVSLLSGIHAAEAINNTQRERYNTTWAQNLRTKREHLLALRCNWKSQKDMEAAQLFIFTALKAKRQALLANPLLDFKDILFIKRSFLPAVELKGDHICDQYFGFNAIPGGGLFVLRDAFGSKPKEENLLEGRICKNGRFAGKHLPAGGFLSPALSFDGKTVLFCFTEAKGPRYQWTQETTFHIFKTRVDGGDIEQLTDGPWNDKDPCWLPDGRIAFISERKGGYNRCTITRINPVAVLHVMNSDGTNIQRLSENESDEWQPAVLWNGLIVHTRWDYVDRGFNQTHMPWTITPAGTEPHIVHGNYPKAPSDHPIAEMNIRPVPGSHKLMATAAARHGQAYGSIVLIDPDKPDDNAMGPLTKLTPETPFPESTAPAAVGQRYATPWPLDENHFLCVYDPEGQAYRGTDNHYSIYLADCWGNRTQLHNPKGMSALSPIPLRATPTPPVVSRAATPTPDKTAEIMLVNVYNTDKKWPPGTKISNLRIYQIIPKTTPYANSPAIGYGEQNCCRAVLGTVPIEPDGSAHFTVPVDRPLFFQAVDEQGQAVQSMKSLTFFRSGEKRRCVGCHVRDESPAEGRKIPPSFHRTPSAVEPGPIGSNPFDYTKLVQPVLDRWCVKCHADKGAIALTPDSSLETRAAWWQKHNPGLKRGPTKKELDTAPAWTRSYINLEEYAFEPRPTEWSVPDSDPGKVGAKRARLTSLLDGSHYGVKPSDDDLRRIWLWLDSNSDFQGNFGAPVPIDEASKSWRNAHPAKD